MSSTELFATTLEKLENGAGVARSDVSNSKERKGEKVKMKINEVIQEMDNETILNIGSGSGWCIPRASGGDPTVFRDLEE